MAGQYRFKDINGNIVAQISASSAGAISFSGSAVDFSNASTITLGGVQLAGTASNALLLDGFDSTAFVFTSSFNTISQSISSQLTTLQTTSGSNIGRLNNLESKSSSVDISISNINTVTESVLSRTSNLESKSSSVDISISNINSFTASNSNTSLNNLTGSLATTGSNTFFGTQTYSGSVYIANDLIVQGSSSIQYISASSVSIGTNIVQLNTANPSVRFAGLTIIDSGSVGGSGSFLYDSVQDEFIFVHRGNGSNVTSSHFVLGPETYDNLGNELYLTSNIIPKGTGKEHLIDSCIFDNGTTTCIKNNLKVTETACFASSIDAATGITIGTSGTNDISWNTSGGIKLSRTNVGAEYALSQAWTGVCAYIDIGSSCQWNGGVRILPNGGGNVGLNCTDPKYTLDVNGLVNINAKATGCQGTVQSLRISSNIADAAVTINACSLLNYTYLAFAQNCVGKFEIGFSSCTDTTSPSTFYLNPNVQKGACGSAVFIKSNGNVGIGTATPLGSLNIQGLNIAQESTLTNPAGVTIGNQSNQPRISLDNGGGAANVAGNQWNIDNSAGTLRIFTAGYVKLSLSPAGIACFTCPVSVGYTATIGTQGGTDTTVIGGGSGVGSQIRMNYAGGCYNNFLAGNGDNYFNCLLGKLNAAGGVKFGNGTTTLNYYEEGSWTPRLVSSGWSSTTTGSNIGWYTRIGNLVTAGGTIQWTGGSGSQGTLVITCLPFTSSSTSGTRNVGQIGAPGGDSISYNYATKGQFVVVNDPNQASMYIIETYQSGTWATYTHGPTVNSSGVIYGFQITYHI